MLKSILFTIIVSILLINCSPEMNWSLGDIAGDVPSELYGTWKKIETPITLVFNEDRSFTINRYDLPITKDGVFYPNNEDTLLLEYCIASTNPAWELIAYYEHYTLSNDTLILDNEKYYKSN